MEADDLLCSRNAREEKGSLVVLLLAERAPSEGPRSTRAFEDRPGHPLSRETSELGGNIDKAVLVKRAQWKINQPPSLRDNERAWRGHLYLMRAVKDSPAASLRAKWGKSDDLRWMRTGKGSWATRL
jgi:hypothetical protein